MAEKNLSTGVTATALWWLKEMLADNKQKEINIFFQKIIYTLIVINILLGGITIYDKFIYVPDTSIKTKHIDKLYPDEV